MLTLNNDISDKRETNKENKTAPRFIESGEDTAKALQTSKQPCGLLALPVHFPVISPRHPGDCIQVARLKAFHVCTCWGISALSQVLSRMTCVPSGASLTLAFPAHPKKKCDRFHMLSPAGLIRFTCITRGYSREEPADTPSPGQPGSRTTPHPHSRPPRLPPR